jgi:hypothetical protein
LPGTFGKAYEAIGSTLSRVDPAALATAHNGSTTFAKVSIATGSDLPITNAHARPAITAA